jgi:hypothetical protein
VATDPAPNTTNVSDSSKIVIFFSSTLKSTTVAAKILVGDSLINCTLIVNNVQVILSPVAGLHKSTTYSVIVPATVTDTAGHKLVSDYKFSFTTAGETFTPWFIDGTKIIDLTSDATGNVYVTGTFNSSSCFVAKFGSNGKLVWRKDITGTGYNYPKGGMVVSGNVVYANICRNDVYGIGDATVCIDAYSCEKGELIWSSQITSRTMGTSLVVGNGYIYASSYSQVFKLSDNGVILNKYVPPGHSAVNNLAMFGSNIIVAGDFSNGSSQSSFILMLDPDFSMIWRQPDTVISLLSSAQSIVASVPDSLLFVGESYGDPLSGVQTHTSVLCYRYSYIGLELIWKKAFDNSLHIGMKMVGSNFYIYSRDYDGAFSTSVNGPIEMSTTGTTIWVATPKKNGNITIFNSKVFVADGNNALSVYN